MRPILAAAAAAALLFTSAPAFAGSAENAFLGKLVGTWSGGGKLNGSQSGPITCKLQFKDGGNGKVNYTGRCNVEDLGAKSFSGSLAYNDSTKRYEARSLANSVVGVKRGGAVLFTTKVSSIGGTSYSTMSVSPSRITIDFTLLNARSGDKSQSHVVLSK